LNAELFVTLLKMMMRYRRRPVHLVLDSLPAHKKACVREYVESTKGKLTLHFLPGYAPDLNPDELVWSHVKRTGVARRPLRKGEKLQEKVIEQLTEIQDQPALVRSFFKATSLHTNLSRFISANAGGEIHHPLQASPDCLDARLTVAFASQEAAKAGDEADHRV
jgi:transposase